MYGFHYLFKNESFTYLFIPARVANIQVLFILKMYINKVASLSSTQNRGTTSFIHAVYLENKQKYVH